MRVLHVIPDIAVSPGHRLLGSTKDVRGRTEYFQTAGINYDELPVVRLDRSLRTALDRVALERYDVVFIELAQYPRSMKWLAKKVPDTVRIVRPTNASSLQHLHLARLGGVSSGGWELLRAARHFQKDAACARHADHVLPITEWEQTHYWRRLTSPQKIVTVPFFVPREYDDEPAGGWQKRDECVCLTSSSLNPLLMDAVQNFERLVAGLGTRRDGWQFVMTGDLEASGLHAARHIMRPGFVSDLGPLLRHARAIALLSDYGYGFKTKVLDAIRYQCYMLITARAYERMPVEVRPFCIVVDPRSAESFRAALERCHAPYPAGNPNEVFRQQAFSALDSIIRR